LFAAFDESLLDVAWLGARRPENTDNFLAARITLPDEAEGRWLYFASSGEEYTVFAPEGHYTFLEASRIISGGDGIIRSGALQVVELPEPATLGLLTAVLAVGAIFGRSRC
jgi:hypothetical protein